MDRYYVNTQQNDNGYHEVHKQGCPYLPPLTFAKYLGDYGQCQDALKDAKEYYPQSNGCSYCCKSCHTD